MRQVPWSVLAVLLGVLAGPARAEEPQLVAHYAFDEGSGAVARDSSGHGNDGRIHGAAFRKQGAGYCLEFDGLDDYVDCGDGPSLDLRGPLTLEAWIFPDGRPLKEPGIAGKHFQSYLLTYYHDGCCWWYINEGGNNIRAYVRPGAWHHVAGVFDGALMKIYVDGKEAASAPSRYSSVASGGRFRIGCVAGDPAAADVADPRTTYFAGQIDEVRLYRGALSPETIQSHYTAGIARLALVARYQAVTPVAQVGAPPVAVRVGKTGAVEVRARGERYLLESAWSYPGERIGWNLLGVSTKGSEPGWSPRVRALSRTAFEVSAAGRRCALRRVVRLEETAGRPDETRIRVEERLTNTSKEPLAVLVRHALTSPRDFRETFAVGGAQNPTLVATGQTGGLGVLIEDDLSRLRWEAGLGLPNNQARFRVSPVVLQPGKSQTLRWSMFPLPPGAGYFDFVNRVRREWRTNFTIIGPFSFVDVGSPVLKQPEALKAYLKRRRLAVAALSPWLDYDPGTFDRVWTRAEYKERMQEAVRAIKAADPSVRCVGSIETDWVTIDPATIPGGEKLPVCQGPVTGNVVLTREQTRILENSGLRWIDSAKRDRNGNMILELYMRGGKPLTALSVYPAPGNSQARFLMEQVRFLLDEVGLDGFYIDEFSQAWSGAILSYDAADGVSGDVDPITGRLVRQAVDCSLAGISTRVALCKYALDRGKIVIANTYATAAAEQALPVQRFSETQWQFDPFAVPEGEEPPPVEEIFRGNLATPIGLGIVGAPERRDTARRVMRAVVTYLRHGALYYHYAIEDIPETGEGSGEYGPINHMFPITPVALGKGFIHGRERIVTCVSGTWNWTQRARPKVLAFDLDGRAKAADATVEPRGSGWRVTVRLRNWAEIAVVE